MILTVLSFGGGGGGSEYFVKGALTFSLMTMLLMTSFIVIFVPETPEVKGYEEEMNELLGEYYNATGNNIQNEQIWGLTGIFTPYGTDKNGQPSSKQLTLKDGWVAGDRVESYTPVQYSGSGSLDNGKLSYTVTYDRGKGLYYYSAHGEDLGDIKDTADGNLGTLYTSVTMDRDHKSQQFFTVGNKQQMENGTFYYNFTGYRYCFQSLSDYYYDKSTPISHTDTSLSLIWYSYAGGYDSGVSGQLVLSGSDSGVAYITAQQITNSFNSANFTSKFTMAFNGIDMNIYIQLSPYAITNGYSVADCYNNGWWSVLVTSPAMPMDSGANDPFKGFNPDKVFDIVMGYLKFESEDYGLTGVAGIVAGTVFSISLYTSLIAIGLSFWPVLLIAGAIAIFQTMSVADLWPF